MTPFAESIGFTCSDEKMGIWYFPRWKYQKQWIALHSFIEYQYQQNELVPWKVSYFNLGDISQTKLWMDLCKNAFIIDKKENQQ